MRQLRHLWVALVIELTSFLPDFKPVLRMRGALVGLGIKRCGRDFQIGRRVTINFPDRLEVGDHVYVGVGSWLHASGGIVIEDEVLLAPYVVLISGDHGMKNGSYRYGTANRAPIQLERGCWLGAHATVTKGVTIGRGALLAANAVAIGDVPDYSIAGGVPAKVLREHVDPNHETASE